MAALPPQRRTADILRSVMLSTVVPQLARQHSMEPLACKPKARPSLAHPRCKELAELLIATDHSAALSFIQELQKSDALSPLYASLFEPAARVLGDLWRDDDCSEFDVTLGLCRLQSIIHLLGTRHIQTRAHSTHPVVLIVPQPGELHHLGAALDRDVLQQAGWSPHCENPATDQALQDLVAGTWFDALDVSMSAAFTRENRVPNLIATIKEARRASCNPALAVLVGGRIFVEQTATARSVGADLATTTSLNVDHSILQMLRSAAAGTVMHRPANRERGRDRIHRKTQVSAGLSGHSEAVH